MIEKLSSDQKEARERLAEYRQAQACACGAYKRPGAGFCLGCHDRLPVAIKIGLAHAHPLSQQYFSYFEAARGHLKGVNHGEE